MIAKLRRDPHRLNFGLNLGLVIAFAVAMEEQFTGRHNHEVLGLIFGSLILVHIALNWDWVVSITKRFFEKLFHESRLNYVLNLALFIDMVVIVVTGILISRTIGFNFQAGDAIMTVHLLASHLSLILIGLHVALHWKWIITHAGKYLFSWHLPRPSRSLQPSQPDATSTGGNG